ncbi:hypothetical protein WBG78_28415 [Chryseolinea sp. T2]|uniref:hypothetical protein n=1 Tax=Chryseolinea sp. T2 TaxID=3129255 RepID=UPI0030788B20
MARTIQEIIDAIFSDKNSRPELNSLNSTSNTSVYRNWVFNAAVAQNSLEQIQDRFQLEVDEIIANNFIGTATWYGERALEFQLGYDLTLVGNKFSYPVVDESSQIIKAVSVVEDSGSTLYIKVATEDSNTGELEALTNQEKTQFSKYITKIKLAGTKINIVSLAADQLVMSGCTVVYDAIYDPAVIKTAVEAALTSYTKSIPFDGKVKTSEVIDVIQGVTGVTDVVLDNLAIKTGSDTIAVGRIAELPAGYVNEATSPLSFDDLITYVGE